MRTHSHVAKPVPASAAGGLDGKILQVDGVWCVRSNSEVIDLVYSFPADNDHSDELESYLDDVRKTVSRPEHVNAVRSLPASFTF